MNSEPQTININWKPSNYNTLKLDAKIKIVKDVLKNTNLEIITQYINMFEAKRNYTEEEFKQYTDNLLQRYNIYETIFNGAMEELEKLMEEKCSLSSKGGKQAREQAKNRISSLQRTPQPTQVTPEELKNLIISINDHIFSPEGPLAEGGTHVVVQMALVSNIDIVRRLTDEQKRAIIDIIDDELSIETEVTNEYSRLDIDTRRDLLEGLVTNELEDHKNAIRDLLTRTFNVRGGKKRKSLKKRRKTKRKVVSEWVCRGRRPL